MLHSRRAFLTYLGVGSYAALVAGQPAAASDFPSPRRKGKPLHFFAPIAASSADELVVPTGFRADVVVGWDHPLGSKAPDGSAERFGFNNDFIAYFPIDALRGGRSSTEGLLWVNHEYPNPLFQSGYTPADYRAGKKKTPGQIAAERLAVGGSVVHVKLDGEQWKLVANF